MPIPPSNTVKHLPIFCPKTIGNAIENVIAPVDAIACNIPTEAEQLCIIAVTTIPTNIPKNGFENL